ASARIRSLYSAVKVRRLASATTSGFGRGGLGGSGATVLPAAVLRSVSLRSSSLRSAAGKTVGEAEEIPLFFTLIPVLALLSNYDRENCLINIGTEGGFQQLVENAIGRAEVDLLNADCASLFGSIYWNATSGFQSGAVEGGVGEAIAPI